MSVPVVFNELSIVKMEAWHDVNRVLDTFIGHFKKSATLVLSWMSIPSIIRHGQGSDLLYL